MKLAMTDKDRKLLIGVCCAAIFIIFYQFLIMPEFRTIQENKLQLADIMTQKDEMDMQISMIDSLEDGILENRNKRIVASKDYISQVWETRRIDEMLTDMVIDCGLFPQTLTLVDAAPATVAPYPLASVGEEGAIPAACIYISSVSITANGSHSDCMKLLDVIEQTSSLHLDSYNISSSQAIAGDTEIVSRTSINCTLQVLMCAEEVDSI